jgi:hypothetical protein
VIGEPLDAASLPRCPACHVPPVIEEHRDRTVVRHVHREDCRADGPMRGALTVALGVAVRSLPWPRIRRGGDV